MKVFVWIALAIAIVLGIVFTAIIVLQAPPDSFERLELAPLSFEAPTDSEIAPFEDRGWSGWHLRGYGQLGVCWIAFEGEMQAQAQLQAWSSALDPVSYRFDVDLMDGGVFLLKAQGKSVRQYVYVFRLGAQLIWTEMVSRHSTLLSYKKVLDHLVATLEVDGHRVSKDAIAAMDALDSKITGKSQSSMFFVLLGMGMYLLMMTVFGLVSWLSGRLPKDISGQVLLAQKHVFVTLKMPLKSKGVFAAAVLTDAEFLVSSFGRKLIRLGRDQMDLITLNRTSRKPRLEIEHERKKVIVRVADAEKWMRKIRKLA